jgi:RNA polymerase sigma factor (sigma-70 family)
MPVDTHATQPGTPGGVPSERWQLLWSHREQLLRVARRRSTSLEDAEDAVHEALLRAVENPHLDDERIGAWLTTVVVRLCADRHRQVDREARAGSRGALASPEPVPVEEVVCDRAEANWLARRSAELPARQAQALRLRSEDLEVGQVAQRMGLSYRTVESLLARARRTLRHSLAATLSAAVGLWARPRTWPAAAKAAVLAAGGTAVTLAAVVVTQPAAVGPAAPGSAPTPAVRPSSAAGAHVPGASRTTASKPPPTMTRTPAATATSSATAAPGAATTSAGGSKLPLPSVSLPPVPSLLPSSMPSLPLPGSGVPVSGLSVSGLPVSGASPLRP